MATFDEMVVRFLFDTSDLEKGAKQAEATVEKTSQAVADAASKGEKAQTGAADAIVAGLNRLATAMEKGGERGVQAQKKVAESNKKVGESFEGAIRTGLTFLAVLAGARTVEDFTRKVTALDAALGRTAYGMGQSPQALSAIGKAVQRMGGDFGGAVAGMRALSDAYQDFRTTGASALTEPLTRLQALSGKAVTFGKDTLANFESIADAIQALDQKGEHALADRFGRQIFGDEGLANLAKRGGAAVRAELAESARHGGLVDPKDVEAAQELQAAYEGLSQSVAGLGTKVETKLSPYLTKLLTQLTDLIDKHADEWVSEFGAFLEKHQPDIDHFTTAIGDLAKSVDGIATSFSTGSPASIALEAFAGLLAVRVLGAVTGLTFAMRTLGGIAAPSWLSAFLLNPAVLGTAAVAGVLASGDPDKIPLVGGHPDVQPQDSDLGLPGVGDRGSDTSDAQAKAGGFLSWFKKAIGWGDKLHDDPKTKDNIEDTAKATKGILEVLKAGVSSAASALGFGGVTESSGGLGGTGRHVDGKSPGASLRDRQFHGKGNFGEKGWWTPDRQGHAIDVLMKDAGLTEDGAKALVARWKFVESAGGPSAVNPHSGAEGIAQWLGTRKGDGSHGTFDEQLAKVARELNGKEARAKRLLNTPGSEARGASAYERAEGWNAATATDNFTGRVAEGMKHIVHGGAPAPKEPTVTVNGTPSHAYAPIGDQAALDAQNRIIAGKGTPADRAIIAKHREQENTPKPTGDAAHPVQERTLGRYIHVTKPMAARGEMPRPHVTGPAQLDPAHQKLADAMRAGAANPIRVELGHVTLGHVGREFLHAMRQAQRLTHHAQAHAGLHSAIHAAMRSPMMEDHRALMAGARHAVMHRHSTVHHVNARSHTKIGSIAVHTRATDAKGIVADLEPVFRRASDAGDFNYGLDG